jgi:hypothetical protein
MDGMVLKKGKSSNVENGPLKGCSRSSSRHLIMNTVPRGPGFSEATGVLP